MPDELIAVRNPPRGRWHRPDQIFDLVVCRSRWFDGYKSVEESPLDATRPADRCPTCWKDTP